MTTHIFNSALLILIGTALIPGNSFADKKPTGFSFCESALKQIPLVQEDNKIEGKNVLDFLHFTADGKVEVQGDSRVKYTVPNDAGDTVRTGFTVDARHCNPFEKLLHACRNLSAPRTEELKFTYQNGKVKDATIQHFEDGAWVIQKVTFLISGDGQTCYVQHVHSNVESPALDETTAEFDLETCKLAHDLEHNKTERDKILKAGGLEKFSTCKSKFAKKALDLYYKDNPNSDSTFHEDQVTDQTAKSAQ